MTSNKNARQIRGWKWVLSTLLVGTACSLFSQEAIQDQSEIDRIMQNPELAGYAISCRDASGKYNALQINAEGSSIDCPEGTGQPLQIEIINAQIVSPPPIGPQFKAAANFFDKKNYFVYQCNQLLLNGKSYLLFYYRLKKGDEKSLSILFP